MRTMALMVLLVVGISLVVQALPAGAGNPTEGEQCLAIIVNRSNPVENFSFADLRKIFLGERSHWQDGHRITVVMLDSGRAERKAVLRLIYQMNERDFDRYFAQATFTGQVFSAPKTLATPAGARKFVYNLPSAIGYVDAGEVDGTVKIVPVDGHLPYQRGYRLRFGTR